MTTKAVRRMLLGGLALIVLGIAAFVIAATTNGNGLECPAPKQNGDCPGFAFFVIDHAGYLVAIGALITTIGFLTALVVVASERTRDSDSDV